MNDDTAIKKNEATPAATAEDTAYSDQDSAWKDLIRQQFEALLEFFFPHIHKDIDFSKGYEFMDTALLKLEPAAKIGRRYADEIVKVYLHNGKQKLFAIFIHIEIQGYKDEDFEKRLFTYYYRVYDSLLDKDTGVVTLAIMTDEDTEYRPDRFTIEIWDFKLEMFIPLVKLIDYRDKPDKKKYLETSTSWVALLVKIFLDFLDAQKTTPEKKYDLKKKLAYMCYRSGYNKIQIEALLKFIDWIIRLPPILEKKLKSEIFVLEEDKKMPYITSWERMAREEAWEESREVTWKEAREESRREKISAAQELLVLGLSVEQIAKIIKLPEDQIKQLIH